MIEQIAEKYEMELSWAESDLVCGGCFEEIKENDLFVQGNMNPCCAKCIETFDHVNSHFESLGISLEDGMKSFKKIKDN
jgi:hypothetical protein